MTPIFFGSRERRCFGIFTPAADEASRRAAVLCPAVGQEYLRAHRTMRQLAIRLNRAGHHVLRFDYYGTGDSGGDMIDADLHGCERDIDAAIEELRAMTDADAVELVGLRLGATLAASVAARKGDEVSALVLWDPVKDGRSYLETLRATTIPRGPRTGPHEELFGFEFSATLLDQLAARSLAADVRGLSTRTLLIDTDVAGSLDTTLGAPIQIARLPAPCPWVEENNTGVGALPLEVLDRVVAWLA